MARVLDAGLSEEARAALLEAVAPLGCAIALELRLPEPDTIESLVLPPLSPSWREALPLLREFTSDATRSCLPLIEAVAGFFPTQS